MTAPADPYQTALSEYGAVAVFAQGNPEVNAKLQEAIAGKWDAARFERELWTTNWYKSLSDNQRQIEVQQATDPSAYANRLAIMREDVANQAAKMGVNVDINRIATEALWNNFDAGILQAHIAREGGVTKDGNGFATGQAGETQAHLQSTAAAFGVPMSQDGLDQWARSVMAGNTTIGGLDNQIRGMASKLYPQYSQDFAEGRTLSDVAKPYMQQMANVLEIDPSHINVMDPTIMQALHGDGATPTPLYAFTQGLKADPRWGKTDNAKQAAYDTVAQIGSDWGFK